MTNQEQLRNQIELENESRTKAIRLRRETDMQSLIAELKQEVDGLKSGLLDIKQRVLNIETASNNNRKGKTNG